VTLTLPTPWARSASTVTRTEREVRPTRRVSVKKLTRSPTNTGAWNSTSRMATVTSRPETWRCASTAPAWSMWERMMPPKIVPWALVCLGIMTTRIAG
jgi:hypothetical protein